MGEESTNNLSENAKASPKPKVAGEYELARTHPSKLSHMEGPVEIGSGMIDDIPMDVRLESKMKHFDVALACLFDRSPFFYGPKNGERLAWPIIDHLEGAAGPR